MIKSGFVKGNKSLITLLLALFLSLSSSDLLLSQTITTGSLVREMVDLKSLAEYPDPAYQSIQFSSYDRRSVAPDKPNWFANSDGFGQEPIPGFIEVLKNPGDDGIGEYLMCDIKGPGAIVRLWTAAINGDIRLYLDDVSKPFYEGPAQPFFLETYKTVAPDYPSEIFTGSFSQNMAGYYPVPFAKRCRIEWIGDLNRLHFYHIGVRVYDQKALVKTFSVNDLNLYKEDLMEVANLLKDPVTHWTFPGGSLCDSPEHRSTDITIEIPAGEERELLKLKGAGAIECITLQLSAGELNNALRQTVLNISFDGSPWGEVQSPVGDFFGAAPGINPYQSLPFSVMTDGTMICRFVMPYHDSVRLSLKNTGEQPIFVSGSVLNSKYEWIEGKSMHFRARWRVDHNLFSSNEKPYDIPYLVAHGKGVIVGAAAMIMNPTPVPSSWGNWWGEGDEKIFVDENDFPSFFGTGSEDYFNYAWSSSEIFEYGYCGQPRNDGPANRGFVTNYRYHILDAIPFASNVAFYMELLSHGPVPGFSYGRIIYHYGLPGMIDDHIPLSDSDVKLPQLPENWMPVRRYFCANADFYQAEDIAREGQEFELNEKDIWAGGKILVWKGETISFTLPIKEEGEYTAVFTARRSPDSGSFESEINGQTLKFGGKTLIDLSVPYRTLARNFVAAPVKLAAGEQILTLINKSDPGKPIGIDFIWIMRR